MLRCVWVTEESTTLSSHFLFPRSRGLGLGVLDLDMYIIQVVVIYGCPFQKKVGVEEVLKGQFGLHKHLGLTSPFGAAQV